MPRRSTLRCTSSGRFRIIRFLALVCALLIVPEVSRDFPAPTPFMPRQQPNAGTPGVQGSSLLETGKRVERELAGGQNHRYQIRLQEGEYAGIVVEQRGIDVVLRLFEPDGKLIAEFDSEITTQGKEKVELVASATRSYRLDVDAKLKNTPAGRYEIVVAEVRLATEHNRWLHEARVLLAQSLLLSRAGEYTDALQPAELALEIREKVLGSDHPATAALLNRIGILNSSLHNTAKAERLFQQALDIYQKRLGRDDLTVADPLNNLAVLYKDKAEFVEAETMLQRVLMIREQALGPDHTLVAATLNNLGTLYRKRGNNRDAERAYERSREIRERTLGANHRDLAPVLENLAALSYYKGDYAGALTLDRRVLEIREKNSGPDHPDVAEALSNLALVYAELGQLEKAEPLYERALAIAEKKFGRDHPNRTATLHNLGKLYLQQGDYTKAEPFFQRALQIAENAGSPNDTTIAYYLNSLGSLYTLQGNYAQAEKLLSRALKMRERVLDADHYDVGRTCAELARLYGLQGDVAPSLMFQGHAIRISEKNIALNLAIGSEHQKLSYMSLVADDLNQAIGLHANLAPENAVARDQSITSILQRKGRVLDAMTDSLKVLRQRSDAQDRILIDRLNDTYSQLAELTLSGPQRVTLLEHQKRIKSLEERRGRLENEVSRRSAGFYAPTEPMTLSAIQSAIPDNAALIEFFSYRPFDSKVAGGKLGSPRYVVYVIRRQGEILWKELGETKPIHSAIDEWRKALRDPKRTDVQQLARAVDEKLMQPVRPLAGDATQLLLSPEGALNLIPFEALIDEQNRYLIERYRHTYLTSGRDLLRLGAAPNSSSNPLVLADPSFGQPEATRVTTTAVPRARPARTANRQSVTAGTDFSDVYFAPLSATSHEAQAIKSQFPEAVVLTGRQASETLLKQTIAPRMLHIATHGFFLQDAAAAPVRPIPLGTRAISSSLAIENPLLRSGLALAGANLPSAGGDDGILTALEASGLNLWGTKLVTLSACDTGLGELKSSEGVYGLRRAFVLAGAETLVMSLWPVSDRVTRELMTSYYAGLKQGQGRGEALRQVQLRMLKRKERQHPFYWAGFVQLGEWGNLDGER